MVRTYKSLTSVSGNKRKVTLHPFQTKAFTRKERFVALIAGTGGGKTFLGGPWLCNEISKYPGEIWLILAPTYKILSRATMPTFMAFVQGTKFEGVYKESKGIYELPDGGLIYCMSTDNWKGIEGGQYRAAWLDEAGQMQRMAWIAVQARLGLKQGRCLFTTTPYATNWLFTDVVVRWREGDPDYFVIQFRSIDNPYYPVEEYERASRSMDSRLFKMRYDGVFERMAGLVFPEFSNIISDENPTQIIQTEWPKFGGLDWGFNDPFVAMVGALDSDHTFHLFYERYQSRCTIPTHAEMLRRSGMHHVELYFGDPSGAQQIADMGGEGFAVHPGNNDIQTGIEALTARILLNRLVVYRSSCPNLIRESELYRYPVEEDMTNVHTEKPIDANNHALDALRYLIRGIDGDAPNDTSMPEPVSQEGQSDVVLTRYGELVPREGDSVRYAKAVEDGLLHEEQSWCREDNPAIWSGIGEPL